LEATGEYEAAMGVYHSALREHRNPQTLAKLQHCEAVKKRKETEDYLSPELGAEAKAQGSEYFRSSKFPEAVRAYTESVKRNPNDHTVYSNRAAAYMKLGAYDEAIKDCESCLEIDPGFVKAVVRLAHCYFWRKEYHKAAREYEKGLKLDPQNEECREGVYRTQRKIMEAMQSGEQDEERIARAKADPEIQQILADSYMQMVLREMSMDPKRVEEYMRDPSLAEKIQKLVLAGVLSFGPSKPGK